MIRALARVAEAGPRGVVLDVPDWPGHRPGQFAMLALDPSGARCDPLLPRPMAVFRGRGERLEFRFEVVGRGTRLLAELRAGETLGVVGRGTRLLAELRAGETLGVVGPLGNGFPEPEGRPLLVGGGTGIASLYEFADAHAEARVLLGGRTREAILGLADFEALPARLDVTTEDGSLGHPGRVTELLNPVAGDELFACGPTPMMRRVAELARAAGVPCWVSLESQMACGFGVCLGCAVPTGGRYGYVCSDGPIFDAAALDWDGLP